MLVGTGAFSSCVRRFSSLLQVDVSMREFVSVSFFFFFFFGLLVKEFWLLIFILRAMPVIVVM